MLMKFPAQCMSQRPEQGYRSVGEIIRGKANTTEKGIWLPAFQHHASSYMVE